MGKKKLTALIICVLLTSGAGLYLLLGGEEEVFPVLNQQGHYSGKIKLGPKQLSFLISKDAANSMPLIVFSDPLWKGSLKDGNCLVSSPDGSYRLTGREESPGFYTGPAENDADGMPGEWSLHLLAQNKNLQSIDEVQSLNQLLNLNSTLQEIESKIEAQQTTISQQKLEIEKISQYLTEGQSFRANADKKFKEKKAELDSLLQVKEAKQKEAIQLREKFDISQRLFGTGKLVYLSRNTLDLEKRWFDSMYTSGGADTDADFENLVARAERIMFLKNEISHELNKFGGGQ